MANKRKTKPQTPKSGTPANRHSVKHVVSLFEGQNEPSAQQQVPSVVEAPALSVDASITDATVDPGQEIASVTSVSTQRVTQGGQHLDLSFMEGRISSVGPPAGGQSGHSVKGVRPEGTYVDPFSRELAGSAPCFSITYSMADVVSVRAKLKHAYNTAKGVYPVVARELHKMDKTFKPIDRFCVSAHILGAQKRIYTGLFRYLRRASSIEAFYMSTCAYHITPAGARNDDERLVSLLHAGLTRLEEFKVRFAVEQPVVVKTDKFSARVRAAESAFAEFMSIRKEDLDSLTTIQGQLKSALEDVSAMLADYRSSTKEIVRLGGDLRKAISGNVMLDENELLRNWEALPDSEKGSFGGSLERYKRAVGFAMASTVAAKVADEPGTNGVTLEHMVRNFRRLDVHTTSAKLATVLAHPVFRVKGHVNFVNPRRAQQTRDEARPPAFPSAAAILHADAQLGDSQDE